MGALAGLTASAIDAEALGILSLVLLGMAVFAFWFARSFWTPSKPTIESKPAELDRDTDPQIPVFESLSPVAAVPTPPIDEDDDVIVHDGCRSCGGAGTLDERGVCWLCGAKMPVPKGSA